LLDGLYLRGDDVFHIKDQEAKLQEQKQQFFDQAKKHLPSLKETGNEDRTTVESIYDDIVLLPLRSQIIDTLNTYLSRESTSGTIHTDQEWKQLFDQYENQMLQYIHLE
jgi:hypothetical protein